MSDMVLKILKTTAYQQFPTNYSKHTVEVICSIKEVVTIANDAS